MADNQFQKSVYEKVKRRKGPKLPSLDAVCDCDVALSEENGKDVTIFIAPPNENDDTGEDSASEGTNPGIKFLQVFSPEIC